jgi:RNA polymerase sigma-70 factor (ECF subfamily)
MRAIPEGTRVVFDAAAGTGDLELELLKGLRAGDERAFVTLVRHHNDSMLRLACSLVPDRAVAEEIVQDTWLGVIRGINRFEGRSSVKTWLLHILVNRARSTGVRERRSVPVSTQEGGVDVGRFTSSGHWMDPPQHWTQEVLDRMSSEGLSKRIRMVLDDLPIFQRQVVTLRDIEGLSSKEVCELLDISEGNQRILLHRGRNRLREELEAEYARAR